MEANLRPAARGDPSDGADLKAVSETLRGNREAFRSIVERHGPLVLRLATSFLRDPQEAEEATQEIFFKAFRSLGSFKLEKAFLPWLYALAVNYLRTRYRRKRRREEQVTDLPEQELVAGDDRGDPASAAEASETRDQLHKAIQNLPTGVRDVVSLYYSGGLSVAQISESLGISGENVKSRLHRGRKSIRQYLARDTTSKSDEEYTRIGDSGREPA